jgi:mRNA interferase MazF
MKEGDIVLASLPQSDGLIKVRPVLLLRKMHEYGDFLTCGISSKLHQEISDFDEIISSSTQNGLKHTSLIRLGFLAILTENRINGRIGNVSEQIHRKLLERLATYLTTTK